MELTWILWGAMAAYGIVMFVISPRAKNYGEFYAARSDEGRDISTGFLVGSVVISWLFAKSITNSANLSATFGIVGAVAYAGWYLSIPVVGVVAYQLRTRFGAKGLNDFITSKYGRLASFGFLVAILIRLFNEVWSNTAVVGAYFGASGTWPYFAAALAFSAITLGYAMLGGLRSSVLTDAFQFGMAALLLIFALALVVPDAGAHQIVSSGDWTFSGGIDLLLVGLLQSLSYGFHDPVLTDRSFITKPKSMLKGYLLSGVLGALFIILFGVIGAYAHVNGLDTGEGAPIVVARAFGVAVLAGMSVMMMLSAGSTLDSTLSSFSRTVTQDVGGMGADDSRLAVPFPGVAAWLQGFDPVKLGRVVMVVTIIIGSLPLFAGAEILAATTISGTMVLGLAPVFILAFVKRAGPFAFNLAFWPGVALGIAFAVGWKPEWATFGEGKYATLLGINVWGTIAVFALFFVGVAIDSLLSASSSRAHK